MPVLFKRNLIAFFFTFMMWMILIILDVTWEFRGTLAGFFYFISLVVLYWVLWYINLPMLASVHNDWLRFLANTLWSTLLLLMFIATAMLLGAHFRLLIGG